ncbi:DUF2147 domain-containing protein [Runella sp.]|uniref:DUF2147 domain-containing protein n=1 Tax=Runella sp. TaxID=1960881 RepID=UPI003D14BDC2
MKKVQLFLFMILFSLQVLAQNNPDACLGTWLTGSKKGHVQIYKQGDKYFGKIVWLKEPNDPTTGKPKMDVKNPDAQKQSRPLIGMINLRDFKYDGDKIWEDGKIYDPENGKEYSCKIKLVNANQLDVRGFIGVALIGRTDSWVRVK